LKGGVRTFEDIDGVDEVKVATIAQDSGIKAQMPSAEGSTSMTCRIAKVREVESSIGLWCFIKEDAVEVDVCVLIRRPSCIGPNVAFDLGDVAIAI
jgi:hypothetical protein